MHGLPLRRISCATLAGFHHRPGLQAERCAGLDRGAQQVAGGDVRHLQFGFEQGGLRAFARPVRAEENDAHGVSGLLVVVVDRACGAASVRGTPTSRSVKLAAAANRVKLSGHFP